jgi:PEGA domain-containing protein
MPPPQQGSDPRDRRQPDPRGGQAPSEYGTVAVRVQPADAEVAIDGENWRGPGGPDGLVIDLAEGSHTVEIRKPGYRTYVTQVEVRRGETTPLNVSLRNEQ